MFSRLRSDVQCILDRDPAARSTWEVLTCYPGLHAVVLHRRAHWFWTHGFKWSGRFVSHIARWLTGIEIHPGAKLGERVFFDHAMGVVVGETAEIGDGCTIYQGVNTKYYYNKKGNPLRPGICECKLACTGQGLGDGDGQCKRITISPFSSGKIIITGAREMDQINEAYVFFNEILEAHQNEILFIPTVAT